MAMCTSYGGGKFVPPSQRPRRGGKGISDVSEYPQQGTAIVPWNPAGSGMHMQPNPGEGGSWGGDAPWMKAAAKPMDSVQLAQGTGWKMKVIYSIQKAQDLYDPQYNEDEDVEKEKE